MELISRYFKSEINFITEKAISVEINKEVSYSYNPKLIASITLPPLAMKEKEILYKYKMNNKKIKIIEVSFIDYGFDNYPPRKRTVVLNNSKIIGGDIFPNSLTMSSDFRMIENYYARNVDVEVEFESYSVSSIEAQGGKSLGIDR